MLTSGKTSVVGFLFESPQQSVHSRPKYYKYLEEYLINLRCGKESSIEKLKKSDPLVTSIIRKSKKKETQRKKNHRQKIEQLFGSKAKPHKFKESSINKNLSKIISVILSNKKFLKLVSMMEKPYGGKEIILPDRPENKSVDFRPDILDPNPGMLDHSDPSYRSVWRYHSELNSWNQESFLGGMSNSEENESSIFAEALMPYTTYGGRSRLVLGRERQFCDIRPLFQQESPTFEPTTAPLSGVPTANLFSVYDKSETVTDISIAFKEFQKRMTYVGNQYIDEKKTYFLEQLNKCTIDRFKALSIEKSRIEFRSVLEAETMLQSEFEGIHEPNSITRPTEAEVQKKNPLDGRFRKGILSNESNTLNGVYTELDAKLLVSDETLQYQADERRILGLRNPNKMSMYEQGKIRVIKS